MSWIVPAALGAWHGLNPAMGWLFAAAIGLQERRAGAVVRALPPIALGHAASVALVLAGAAGARLVVPFSILRVAGATLLLGCALLSLTRRIHPRFIGMRPGARDLAVWSFVMSSAHGAGLMLLPLIMHTPPAAGPVAHAHAHSFATDGSFLMLATHTASMFGVMTAAALVTFHVLGVSFLRRVWLNTDALWAGALALSGLFLLLQN
jgi:hypothetical protein